MVSTLQITVTFTGLNETQAAALMVSVRSFLIANSGTLNSSQFSESL